VFKLFVNIVSSNGYMHLSNLKNMFVTKNPDIMVKVHQDG